MFESVQKFFLPGFCSAQEVYAVNITVQYKWQADFIDPMSNMYKNLSNGIIAGVSSMHYFLKI